MSSSIKITAFGRFLFGGDTMNIVYRDTQAEYRLRAQIRKEIIAEIREACGNCRKLKAIEQTIYKPVPRKVRGVFRG